jgi:hypothetical protein
VLLDIIAFLMASFAAHGGLQSTTAPESHTAPNEEKAPIIVTPPKSAGERRAQLRRFTRQIVRPPRRGRAIARFRFPICPQVIGIAAEDARVIEARIRATAVRIGLGANDDATCTPTIRVAFMAPAAGPAERWLGLHSSQLAHLPIYQRRAVLEEIGPVRAFNRVVLRDSNGQPLRGGERNGRVIGGLDTPPQIEPFSASDPVHVNETTGAAILIERDAAQGFTLAQLADYITMRTLLGTSEPDRGEPLAASTILSLFQSGNPPDSLTAFDLALLDSLYNASRYSSATRVIAVTARKTVEAERLLAE